MPSHLFIATKAFIEHEGNILIIREAGTYKDGSNAGKYDVPGGRIELGQRFDQSLVREVREETGLSVTLGKPFFVSEWRPTVRGEEWQIVGIFFHCAVTDPAVKLGEDHDAYEWVDPSKAGEYPLINNLHAVFDAYLKQ